MVSNAPAETAGKATGILGMVALFVVGCVLLFAGFVIRGLDVGTCPVMGFNEVVSTCIHTFPGTDLPITTTGGMIMIIGGVLVVTILTLLLRARLIAARAST